MPCSLSLEVWGQPCSSSLVPHGTSMKPKVPSWKLILVEMPFGTGRGRLYIIKEEDNVSE